MKAATRRSRVRPGRPYPLGATWDGSGVNFAVFSAHAERIELCVFDARGQREMGRIPLPEYTDQVWHGYLQDARPGLLYGYRAFGPYEPHNGHRFNPHKLLLDPYGKALHGSLHWSDAHYGYRYGSAREDLSFDRRDSARGMPKCMVVDTAFSWGDDRAPAHAMRDTVIYETHLRGFTMLHPDVPEPLRGSFAGFSMPAVVDYLSDLGITAVELLPVHGFIDDRVLVQRQLRNYWGYQPIAFFAPDNRYLATGMINELKIMVKRLHDAGIEVILDVVYNHSGEGDHLGPTLCFRGLDNASYYRLLPDDQRRYLDVTGTGNTLNLSHPRVLQLVTDSLRYWVTEMHVDGFRFDLASTLAREASGFDPGSGFLDAVRQDPVLSGVKLIAEPWDLGPGGYRLGGFPPGWSEWNDKYRDSMRAFWRGVGGMIGEVAGRLTGSSELFEWGGRRPQASVNFITAHDGFTLQDLVSYNERHNEANGEANHDGHPHNVSCNWGHEGPSDDPSIQALRRRQKRNLMASLLISQGVPMLLGGDEIGRTQAGNNNAYCQDNATSWYDWEAAGAPENQEFRAFVRWLIRLRQAHAVFRRGRFFHGRLLAPRGIKDITWFSPEGHEMTEAEWRSGSARCLGYLLATSEPEPDTTEALDVMVLLNADAAPVRFALPPGQADCPWRLVLDTGSEPVPTAAPALPVQAQVADPYPLQGRSVAILMGRAIGPS